MSLQPSLGSAGPDSGPLLPEKRTPGRRITRLLRVVSRLLIQDRGGFLLGVQGVWNAGRRVWVLHGSTEFEVSVVSILQAISDNKSRSSAREAPLSLRPQFTFETLKRHSFGGIETIRVKPQSLRLPEALLR